jgi:para-nitrobenzyl esterase
MYLFTWQSPVLDGKFKAVHCMEIPFAFFNIEKCEEMTGGAKEAFELSKKVSDAWTNFARSGNPNHKGLPTWPKFDASKTATMHFDNKCEVLPQMDKELYDLLGL